MKEGDLVSFTGEWHDIVEVGDVGTIERAFTNTEKKRFQRIWESKKDYRYQVDFNGTILVVSEGDVVPLSIGLLLQLVSVSTSQP